MSYRLLITRDIKKQIADLPGNIRAMARKRIASLAKNPRPRDGIEYVGPKAPDLYEGLNLGRPSAD
jgi:mRNA-degrading endonuclease RelE of RelBE toxin-antitoxin system